MNTTFDRARMITSKNSQFSRNHTLGFTLVELMVGLAISSLVLLAATTSFLSTTNTSRTTSDLAQLQQKGNSVMRIIGMQVRQISAIRLVTNGFVFNLDLVNPAGYNGSAFGIMGTNGASTDSLQTSYHELSDSRNCLGGAVGGVGHVDSSFFVDNAGNLQCTALLNGNSTTATLADNVENFQVRYGVLNANDTIQYVDTPADWNSVTAVEICLQIRSPTANNPAIGTYRDCQGNAQANDGRIRRVFRNTYLLRNQS